MPEYSKFDQKNWIKTNLNYKKAPGSWAWILHRITGIILIGYLFVHIYSLSLLSKGRAAFDKEMASFSTPFMMVLEWFLFAFILFHALNGVRIILVDWADGAVYHKQLLKYSVAAGILLFFIMGYIMFSFEINSIFASL
jgi:succinate dehydrogenase / fumarate reductase cytochrome b subunit